MKFGISLFLVYIVIWITTIIIWILCLIFSLFYLIIKGISIIVRSLKKLRKKKTESVEILRQSALTVDGVQEFFGGVKVGEFILQPDSSSQMRSDLRVSRGKTILVIQAGPTFLLIRTKEEGMSYESFQSRLSKEDKIILRKLATDLTGWIWPDVGEVLRRRVEEFGEDKVLRALRNLFEGVERTMRKQRPFIGKLPCIRNYS